MENTVFIIIVFLLGTAWMLIKTDDKNNPKP